jgi:P27 family predicted phage terminase small subunit
MANPPKATKDHKDKGNYRPSRHANRLEGVASVVKSAPNPPGYFDKRHRELWQTVCKYVFDLGVLAEADTQLIEVYVKHFILWKDAMEDVSTNGFMITVETSKGVAQVRNPAIAVMNESARLINQIADKFGFSPRARMGIKTEPKEEEDPLAELFKN